MNKKNSPFQLAIEPSLISRAQQGDLIAHATLFTYFSKSVYNLAFRLCNQKELAEDVLQNTFLKVINNIDSFRCQAPFGMWLRKIAVNEALMVLRKTRQIPSVLSLDTPDELGNVIDIDFSVKEQHCNIHQYNVSSSLEKILSQLPHQTRIVLWLKEVEGYSHKEISDMMNKSESFSKSLLSRAFKRLQESFSVENIKSEEI